MYYVLFHSVSCVGVTVIPGQGAPPPQKRHHSGRKVRGAKTSWIEETQVHSVAGHVWRRIEFLTNILAHARTQEEEEVLFHNNLNYKRGGYI